MKKFSLFSGVALLALTACQDEKPMLMGGSFANGPAPLQGLNAKRRMDPQVLHSLALLDEGRFKEASQFINQALQTQPRNVPLHLLNGLTYEKMAEMGGDASQRDLAVVGYQNALNVDPNNLLALTKLGALKYQNKQFDQAQEHYANALLIKPNDTNLLQELAAASYYAYDAKTALKAIQKAEKLDPDDPLIKRSSAMIYAALGHFTVAEDKLKTFERAVGDDLEVAHVRARLEDWRHLYTSGRIYLAQSTNQSNQFSAFSGAQNEEMPGQFNDPAEPTVANESQEALDDSLTFSDTTKKNTTNQDLPLPAPNSTTESYDDAEQVIVDAYMLRIVEDARTSKGNNILENLSVTLSPGGFQTLKGRAKGSGLTNIGEQSTSVSYSPASGFGGQSSGQFTPGGSQGGANINNPGSFSTRVFSSGLSWAGLTYNLNIANAVDQRTEVTARPSLSTFLNQQSVFFSGTELVQGFAGQISGTLVTYPVGVTLVVKPIAKDGNTVSLEISVEGSLINDPSPSLGATVNVLKTRVDTKVKMELGETLMLGGIYERIEEMAKSGFPGLRDTPIIQYMFSNEETFSTRRSVVIMLTPRSPDAVAVAVRRAMSKKDLSPALNELVNRNPEWLQTEPNLVKIFKFLSKDPVIYQEFRNGDVLPPSWGWEPVLKDQLNQVASFLYY